MSTNLDTEIRIKSHLIQKHDLEVNWNKATGFVPYKGQLIVYDIEVDKDGNTLKDTEGKLLLPEGRTKPYTYERIKIGDGIHTVADSDLPFIDNTSLKYTEQELTKVQKSQARENISAAELKRDFKFIINGFIMSNWTCEIVDMLGSFEDAIKLDASNFMGAQHWYAIYDTGAWTILGATDNGWIPFQNLWTAEVPIPGLPAYTYSGIVQELPTKTDLLNKVFVFEQFIAQDIDASAIGRPGSAIGAEEFNHLTNSATGMNSHAEGEGTQATGYAAHAEGQKTVSSGNAAHAEGYENIASGYTAHAEGRGNNAEGDASHVEGIENDATGEGAHAEGRETDALGAHAHAEGYQNVAEGDDSHAEGYKNLATGGNSHVEGLENVVIGNGSHAEGMSNTVHGGNAHAEGARNVVFGQASHAEGWGNKTYECGDHAEGYETRAGFRVNSLDSNWQSEGDSSAAHAEGTKTRAEGLASHAEGSATIASGNHSHAGGYGTFAFGNDSTAVGAETFAAGTGSFASGYGGNNWRYFSAILVAEINPAKLTISYRGASLYLYESDLEFSTGSFDQAQVGQFVRCCPVEPLGGYDPVRLARITGKGQESLGLKRNYIRIDRPLIDQEDLHTLEENNITSISIDFISNPNSGAIGNYSHTEGNFTIAASDYQHVQGKYNLEDTENTYAHIVGNGTSNTKRSNAHTLDWSGNAWFAGDVYVGGTGKDTGSKKLVAYDENGETPVLNHIEYSNSVEAMNTQVTADYDNAGYNIGASVSDVMNAANVVANEAYNTAAAIVDETFPLYPEILYGTDTEGNRTTISYSKSTYSNSVPYRDENGAFEVASANIKFTDPGGYSCTAQDAYSYAVNNDGKGSLPVTVDDIRMMLDNFDINLSGIKNAMGAGSGALGEEGCYGVLPIPTSSDLQTFSDLPLFDTARDFSIPVRDYSGNIKVNETPMSDEDATSKKYVDDNFIAKTAESQTVTGNLAITGNLQVQGTTETVDAVTYKIENNVIEFNPDKIYNKNWLTGLAINKGRDGETDLGTYGIMYDPSTDAIKLGFGQVNEENKFKFNINESAPIATREEFNDKWEEDEIFVFDKKTKKFKHSGKTLSGFKKEIQDEMKAYMVQFVADYVENYMSSETIIKPDGTIETNSDILYVNGVVTESKENDGSTILYVEEK